jgi:MFS family permease
VSADFFNPTRISSVHGEEAGRAAGSAAGAPPASKEEDGEKRSEPSVLLLLAIFLSVFLAAIDISIITTALPTMAEHMNTSQKGFAWIGSAYLLSGAASEPIWARVSDIFGRRPVMMCANMVFLGGSVMCALSKHLGTLLTGRVVQGLGSGGLLVLSNILIGDLYSPRQVPR